MFQTGLLVLVDPRHVFSVPDAEFKLRQAMEEVQKAQEEWEILCIYSSSRPDPAQTKKPNFVKHMPLLPKDFRNITGTPSD